MEEDMKLIGFLVLTLSWSFLGLVDKYIKYIQQESINHNV